MVRKFRKEHRRVDSDLAQLKQQLEVATQERLSSEAELFALTKSLLHPSAFMIGHNRISAAH